MTDTDLSLMQNHRQREFWLDLARSIAIISVSFNHALHRSFLTGNRSLDEFQLMSAPASLLKAFLYVFSRIGVPLFLMISGALLIPRNFEDKSVIKRFIRHNWWAILRTTLIWLFIYFWYLQIFSGSILRTRGVFAAVLNSVSTLFFFNQTTYGNMWYMPMILCVYLIIPVFSIGLKKLGNKYIFALSVIVLVGGFIIPNLNTAIDASGSGSLIDWSINHRYVFSVYLLYVLSGYWIRTEQLKRFSNTFLWIVLLLGIAATSLFQYWIYSTPSSYRLDVSDIGILIISVVVFELIRRKASSLDKLKQPVTCLSRISLGVFFVHICIVSTLSDILDVFAPSVIRFQRFIVLEAATMIISVLLVLVTSKIRFFRRYLYLIKE